MLTGGSDKKAGSDDTTENDTDQNDFEAETSHHKGGSGKQTPGLNRVFSMNLTQCQKGF